MAERKGLITVWYEVYGSNKDDFVFNNVGNYSNYFQAVEEAKQWKYAEVVERKATLCYKNGEEFR